MSAPLRVLGPAPDPVELAALVAVLAVVARRATAATAPPVPPAPLWQPAGYAPPGSWSAPAGGWHE